MSNETARFAAISCTHVPYHNVAAIDRLCEHLATWELTDFVLLGDLFEAAAVSLHGDSHPHVLHDEYAAAAALLEQIESALPQTCKLHWLLGNHDDNIQINDSRRTDPRIREMMHWSYSPFARTFAKWTQYPYRKPSIHNQDGMLRLGQVCFIHGFQAGLTSDNNEAKRMRFALGGVPHLL
ncbi:MAG: metallophosphoesterase, partial [Pirellulaceae bacterium]|nr:metallophosphoesterase [Pirellulaceae bacterium]